MNDVVTLNDINKIILNSKKVKAGIRAEEVRERLDPEALVNALLQLARDVDADNIAVLTFTADIYATVLKKCMPDLRSLEIKEGTSKTQQLVIEMGTIIRD